MHRATRIEVRDDYRIYVEFSDGVCGEIDLAERLFGPMFEPLREPTLFSRASIDEFGAISWPNGADLAPDAVHRSLAVEEKKSAT
jgi:hypothetical protein